ncbi:hypothetical protein GBAR_LOCUS31803 [Geodia barretti]|uniref:Uncharacterized protein n=1 Tax=Geodia barretti TaxID=519541 RepID=A0AA35U317_GEOBA|nr:hypothetical protein GBAR_LOCUS31803 [Geodia barretti]
MIWEPYVAGSEHVQVHCARLRLLSSCRENSISRQTQNIWLLLLSKLQENLEQWELVGQQGTKVQALLEDDLPSHSEASQKVS